MPKVTIWSTFLDADTGVFKEDVDLFSINVLDRSDAEAIVRLMDYCCTGTNAYTRVGISTWEVDTGVKDRPEPCRVVYEE